MRLFTDNINLKDPSASLTYDYEKPVDFTDALVKVKMNLDYSYYNNEFLTGTTFVQSILYLTVLQFILLLLQFFSRNEGESFSVLIEV